LIEKLLERKVLYLACSIIPMKFFWRKPSAPQWPNVVVTDYKPGVEVPVIADALCVISAEVMDFPPPRVSFMKPVPTPVPDSWQD